MHQREQGMPTRELGRHVWQDTRVPRPSSTIGRPAGISAKSDRAADAGRLVRRGKSVADIEIVDFPA